jgi:hypothetical protein
LPHGSGGLGKTPSRRLPDGGDYLNTR